MTLQVYLHTAPIFFVLYFDVLGRMLNRSCKIIAAYRLLARDSWPESESAKFYRLQPKRSTPIFSNPCLYSNSAALITSLIISVMDDPYRNTSITCELPVISLAIMGFGNEIFAATAR